MSVSKGTNATQASGLKLRGVKAPHNITAESVPRMNVPRGEAGFAQFRFSSLAMIGVPMNRPVLEGLRLNVPAYVKHDRLVSWVADIAALTEAAEVYWCDGGAEEYRRLCDQLVEGGTMLRLNPAKAT